MLLNEINNNAAFFKKELPGVRLCNFAYPFGEVSPFPKLSLQHRFASCRGTRLGLNVGVVDLGLLRAVPLCEQQTDVTAIFRLIEEAVTRKAWLIFYTHDVDPHPMRWGCSPDYFEKVVKMAAASDVRVLTIRDSIDELQIGRV
jgi:hypothetical protein